MFDLYLSSFGNKYGAPSGYDFVFDVSNFPNPAKTIRDKYNGTHKSLQQDLFSLKEVQDLYASLLQTLSQKIHRYIAEMVQEQNTSHER